MRRQLTLACGDYDRTHALVDGTIKPEGLELNWLDLPHLEIWTRMLNFYDFDASEMSLASYVIAKTLDKPLIALPLFPARAFRHSYIFINANSGIKEPRDLIGKRVGLGEFQQTATVWIRGIMQHEYGIDLSQIRWFTWTAKSRMEMPLPKRYQVEKIQPGLGADQWLIRGDLDAVLCASLFPSFARGAPNVRRLFENYQEVEAAYFRKTGIFPIMHTLVMREELWREQPWIATSLYQAFQQAKGLAYRRLDDLSPYKISMAWFREPMQRQREILGEDPWCDGLEANRKTVETLVEYLYEQEMISRKPTVEELFAPNIYA
jgi:4,5-dihydroxyphthalate decarboxylase